MWTKMGCRSTQHLHLNKVRCYSTRVKSSASMMILLPPSMRETRTVLKLVCEDVIKDTIKLDLREMCCGDAI